MSESAIGTVVLLVLCCSQCFLWHRHLRMEEELNDMRQREEEQGVERVKRESQGRASGDQSAVHFKQFDGLDGLNFGSEPLS
jgi:hypothetical protein